MRKCARCGVRHIPEQSDDWCTEYNLYLASECYARCRESIVGRVGVCELCGTDTLLTLHHLDYRKLGEETECNVVVLCKQCHVMEEE